MYLELDRLSKQFDGKYAMHDLSLGLEEGGMVLNRKAVSAKVREICDK